MLPLIGKPQKVPFRELRELFVGINLSFSLGDFHKLRSTVGYRVGQQNDNFANKEFIYV